MNILGYKFLVINISVMIFKVINSDQIIPRIAPYGVICEFITVPFLFIFSVLFKNDTTS